MSFEEIYVAGRWRRGAGEMRESINPADGSVVAVHGTAGIADVEEAADAGRRAAADPAWRDMLPHVRARLLHRIGDAIAADADGISALQTADTGKTLAETRALALSAAGTFRYMAAALETMDDVLTTPRGPNLTLSVHEPMGVVGAITPWNSPIASDAQKLAPALAAGNAVLLKPAEWTSLVSLRLARIVEAAGLPPGLLSVLPGDGAVIGDAIVRHPLVGKVAFTGGTVTGRRIAAVAAQKLMPVSLELGGKSPTIVMADADIDQAIAGILYGVFSSTGQSCIAGTRLFVPRSIFQPFVEQLVAKTRSLRIGRGTDTSTQVAPLVAFAHRDSVEAHVDRAVASGAQVLTGGSRPEGPAYANGAFYAPTILAGVTNDAAICQQEVFGPVLVAMPFDDLDSLVETANDSVYGLACGIWTRDFPAAYALARRIEAGTVWINTYKQFSISTPFGGMKESGLGREKGRDGIRQYMNQKSIYVGMDPTPLRWA